MMGDLAFLYRMMQHLRYTVPQVNEMEVWECAVALGVDATHEPWFDGESKPHKASVIDDAVFNTPVGVIEMSPEDMERMMAGGMMPVQVDALPG